MWFSDLADSLDLTRPHVINDSKTPSGRVHVGALRGVLMHDAVHRALASRGAEVKYIYGVDDYDPVDEIPAGQGLHFEKFRGAPLCNVPPPPGSTAPDMATHYIGEFFDVFRELGVQPEIYRMRDVYRAGGFNEPIDRILSRAADVRRIYKEVSGSVKSDDWHPFQVVCEVCGRIGTTRVSAYDGKEVTYRCEPKLVKWAQGCGHEGKVSPFDGRGKLPWKLEWVAKWRAFGVTIEGAGKDHTTKGGARDVANRCFEALFGGTPPRNIPYEFFLTDKKKMSSSKGLGASAREMADFLPPEILRFLMLRTEPKQPVDFKLNEDYIVKLFNDFDRLKTRAYGDPKARDDERELYRLCEVAHVETEPFDASFQLVLALVQMPHLDVFAEIEKRKGSPLSAGDRQRLERRVGSARTWIERYADEEEKMRLQETLPARAADLGAAQRYFLRSLSDVLRTAAWDDESLQAALFDVARATPIDNGSAFQAVYRALLDRTAGPRAGSLIAFLDRDFVVRRFGEVSADVAALWRETAVSPEDAMKWIEKEKAKIAGATAVLPDVVEGVSVVDLRVTFADGKVYLKRVRAEEAAREGVASALVGAAHSSMAG